MTKTDGAEALKNKRRKRFGDRKEGRKLRTLSPMSYVFPYIIPKRSGCTNYFQDSIDMTKVDEYIAEKRAEGMKGFGFFHVLVAAYVRTVAARPGLNRFISRRKIYARNDIDVMMMVKKELSLNSEENCIRITPEPDYTAKQVYELINDVVKEARESEGDSSFENAARALSKIPGSIMSLCVRILRVLDFFDLLPMSLLKVSPFHGSMFLTSLGSLGMPPIYHHLYNFGNIPLFVSYGSKRKENVLCTDGTIIEKTFIDYTVTTDDRTCDGHYYSSSIKLFKTIMSNPWQLDEPPKEILEDVE